MSDSTRTPARVHDPDRPRPVRNEPWVLLHEDICPHCGGTDIVSADVETGDGHTEIALTCRACGTCWPIACIVEWDNRP